MNLRKLFYSTLFFASVSTAAGCVMGTRGAPVRGSAYGQVQSPGMLTVSNYPPQPRNEIMTPSPGYGNVWVDGYWHWNNVSWVWISGRWEYPRNNYVYVSPYYDYYNGNHVYVRGYWSPRSQVPQNYSHYDKRGQRPVTYRRPVRSYDNSVHAPRGYRPPAGPSRPGTTAGRPSTTRPSGPAGPGRYTGPSSNGNNGSTYRPPSGPATTRPPTTYTPPSVGTRPSQPSPSTGSGPTYRPPSNTAGPTYRPPTTASGSGATRRPATTQGGSRPTVSKPSPTYRPSQKPSTSTVRGPTSQTPTRSPTRGVRAPAASNKPTMKAPRKSVKRGNLNSPIKKND